MNAGSDPHPIRLRPELLDDVVEAFAWYEAQAEGIGLDFNRAFFAAVARASRQPEAARVVYAGFRRVRCAVFRTRSTTVPKPQQRSLAAAVKLGMFTHTPAVDATPLRAPVTPEERTYTVQPVIKDGEVGVHSTAVSVG